jgi:hypothetical protein
VNAQPGGNAYGQQGPQQPYPQQPYPQQPYPQQPYPQQTGPQQPYPQQTGPQPLSAAAAAPCRRQPASPLALPCSSDITCGAHRCNMQTQRCSFPCAASAECNAGFGCMAGVCVPGAP